jgi:hypothetical protein
LLCISSDLNHTIKNKWFKLITTVLFFTFVPVNTEDRTPPLLPSPGLWCGWRAQVLRRALARGEASAYPAPPPRRVPRAAVFRPRAASVSLPVYIAVWESRKLPRFSCTRSSHPSVATSSFTSAKHMYSSVQTKHMDFFSLGVRLKQRNHQMRASLRIAILSSRFHIITSCNFALQWKGRHVRT